MICGRASRCLAFSLFFAVSACSTASGERPPASGLPGQDPAAARASGAPGEAPRAGGSSPFAPRLLAAAKAYASYGRIGERASWAPTLCAAPLPENAEIDVLRFSKSGDGGTHGQKLYYLYAADRQSYRADPAGAPAATSPVGQIIVKEAWVPEEVQGGPSGGSHSSGSIEREGRTYRPARVSGLFVMMKLDPATPDTDQGWVYGTVAADRVTVTSAGRVASCMGCHERAGFDRLFGADTKSATP